ncbi:MAG: hypothetical protein HY767_02315, partial [Candidatus Omnitrophica bacterium]|nr:hypothetical protein [Candidatus Omnitrophota bacterium]
ALKDVSDAAVEKPFVTEVVQQLDGAILYNGMLLLPISGSRDRVGVVTVVKASKVSEVSIPGLGKDRRLIPMAAGRSYLVGTIESARSPIPQDVIAQVIARSEVRGAKWLFPTDGTGALKAEVAPGLQAVIGQIPASMRPAGEDVQAAQEKAIQDEQFKAEQERIAVNLPKYLALVEGSKIPEGGDHSKQKNLTPQETAFRKILLNRNLEQKLAALKDVGVEGLSQAAILRLLRDSSPDMIRRKIRALRAIPGISINTTTVSFSMEKIQELADQALADQAVKAAAKPVVTEKPAVAPEAKPAVPAFEMAAEAADAVKARVETEQGGYFGSYVRRGVLGWSAVGLAAGGLLAMIMPATVIAFPVVFGAVAFVLRAMRIRSVKSGVTVEVNPKGTGWVVTAADGRKWLEGLSAPDFST